jgi:hypothetical protein
MLHHPPLDEANALLLAAAFVRWDTEPPINVFITRQDLWCLVSALQLVCRHPELTHSSHLGRQLETLGRHLQTAVPDTPELAQLLEAGWSQ